MIEKTGKRQLKRAWRWCSFKGTARLSAAPWGYFPGQEKKYYLLRKNLEKQGNSMILLEPRCILWIQLGIIHSMMNAHTLGSSLQSLAYASHGPFPVPEMIILHHLSPGSTYVISKTSYPVLVIILHILYSYMKHLRNEIEKPHSYFSNYLLPSCQ